MSRVVKNQYSFDERPWTDKDLMEELAEDMTQEEMAEELGCSQDTINRWLNKLDIDYKTKFDRPNKNYVGFVTRKDGYERWKHWNGEEQRNDYVYVHRLLAVSEYGISAVKDKDVHHINDIRWDNRPDNIEIMTHGGHMSYHHTKRWKKIKEGENA